MGQHIDIEILLANGVVKRWENFHKRSAPGVVQF
jgi:hypothetical protein